MLEVGPVRETAKLPRNVGHVGWVSFGSSERDGFQEMWNIFGRKGKFLKLFVTIIFSS